MQPKKKGKQAWHGGWGDQRPGPAHGGDGGWGAQGFGPADGDNTAPATGFCIACPSNEVLEGGAQSPSEVLS